MTLLAIIGHILVFFGALCAVRGNTWDSRALRWFRKLTPWGWFAATIAAAGLGVYIATTVLAAAEERSYRALALQDLATGWRQFATALIVIEDMQDGTFERPSLAPGDLSALRESGAIWAVPLPDMMLPMELGNGQQPPLGVLICQQFGRGMTVMERTVESRGLVLPARIDQIVTRIRRSQSFPIVLASGNCAQGVSLGFEGYAGAFSEENATELLDSLIALEDYLGDHAFTRDP